MSYGDAQWVQQASQPSTQLQGQVNGQNWYAPVPFNPASIDGGAGAFPDQEGYLYFGSQYDPNSNPDAYMYEPYFYGGNQQVNYGSSQQNQVDPNGSFGGLVGQTQISQGGANGIQTPQGIQGAGPVVDNVSYSQPSSPQSQQTSNPWTSYMFGNNGDQGNIQGTFGQGYNGPTTFFQSQPSSVNPSSQAGLGTFTPWNPSMQALQQSRSPNAP